MNKIVLLFPGQGSQYVGMGSKLPTEFKQFFSQADAALGYSLSGLCFSGPEDQLKLTQNTQPAIVTHSLALFTQLEKILHAKNLPIYAVLGHSVGEYAALAAAGVMNLSEAVKAVHDRGKAMQEAVPVGKGKMVAVLKLSEEIVSKACKEASVAGSEVMPANFNDPKQIVISGHAEACDRAIKWLEENIKERFGAIPLQVSAPFHSSLMKPAEEKMKGVLNEIKFQNLKYPYLANIDAKFYSTETSPQIIKDNLIKQICGSVMWTQSILNLPEGCLYIEVGPGKVLSGLVKRIRPEARILSLDQDEAFTQIEEFLK